MPFRTRASAPSEVASSALAAATHALSVCAEAISVLDARVAFLESALSAAHGLHLAANPRPIAVVQEARSHVSTATAANMLGLAPSTLRRWAKQTISPLSPVREKGRLMWPVVAIRKHVADVGNPQSRNRTRTSTNRAP